MKWEEKISKFNYNGSPVQRTKAVCKTPVLTYVVYESVGGRALMYHNKMINQRDPLNEISPRPVTPCGTVKAGKLYCELHFKEIVDSVNECYTLK